jgi:quercetin dioxygenase-like cupin family protein
MNTGQALSTHPECDMIHRYYQKGKKLDVAGLNRITVLIDRSETELTEVGWNCWRSGLVGPPHKHDDKDQIFYVTSGSGLVRLGGDEREVEPGNAVYLPAGLVHQTITRGRDPLCYILFNIFNNPGKEGHATFADHIEKVKHIRRRQADSGRADVEGKILKSAQSKPARFFEDVFDHRTFDFGTNLTILLLDRTETNRCEFVVVEWPPKSRGSMKAHNEKEQTFFILRGHGTVTVGNETEAVKPGDLVFVPRNAPHASEAADEPLTYLCLNSIVIKSRGSGFKSVLKRFMPGRIARWASGSGQVGE